MDRNSILGLIIIGGILVFFTVWNTPDKDKIAQAQRQADSIAIAQQITKEVKAKSAEISATDSTKVLVSKEQVNKDNFGSFANAAEGKQSFYTIENDLLKISLSSKGGRPYNVELKKYKTFDKKPLYLFNGDSTEFGLNFYSQNNRIISTNNLFFKPAKDSLVTVLETDTAKTIALRMYASNNQYIEYAYTMRPGSYKVDLKIQMVNMDSLVSSNTNSLDLNWKMFVPAQEKDKTSENTYTKISYKFLQDEVEKFEISNSDPEKSENIRNKVKWIAFQQQFFSTVLIAGNNFENATITQSNITDSSRYLKVFKSEIGIPYELGKSDEVNLAFYFGPNHYQTLKGLGLELQELVSLGSWIIKWINQYAIIPIFNFLAQFSLLNFGIIILILTVIIKLVLFPLTYKSYLSMAKMRVLKPQIDEINERIPADKAMERQQATMALYRKVGVNPLGGCLPLLLQMPILIAMYNFFPTSIELRQQGFLWATDLSSYDAVISWTTNIPLISSTFGNHISLFNVLMTITTIITIHMSNQTNTSQQQFPGMKTMMYLMPVVFMFVLNSFSSGLTYYYFLANLITIIQNEIFRRSINEEKLLHQLNENKKKPAKKSSFQAKLEEAAKRRGYNTKK
jgi:YidC/Oxa1 family membrane protein insertase